MRRERSGMTNYRYPAPFDAPPSAPVDVPGAPAPPIYCGPPLPVDIPCISAPTKKTKTLYQEFFGGDLSALYDASEATWASNEQRNLSMSLLSGQKSLDNLTSNELDILNEITTNFLELGGGYDERMQQRNKRLPVLEEDSGGREEVVQLREEPGVRDYGVSDEITKAYD